MFKYLHTREALSFATPSRARFSFALTDPTFSIFSEEDHLMTRLAVIFVFITAAFLITVTAQQPPVLKGDQPAGTTGQPPALKGTPGTTTSPAVKPTMAAGDDDVISVETNLVTTPVSVLDRSGRFIAGLKKKDFKIFENDIPQTITYFQTSEQPFTVFLLIDISPSTKYKIDEIHYAAITFINQLRPTDKVMVVAFDQRVRVLTPEPTSDKQLLYAAVYKANFGSGTSLYEAVDYVANLDLVNAPGRKAVVIFTDGVDTTSRRASYESTIAAVQEVDALVYPIRYNTQTQTGVVSASTGAPVALPADIAAELAARGITIAPGIFAGTGRGQSPAEYARGRTYLDALAQNTGGRMFEAETISNLSTAFSGVAEELRQQYSIGYYPEETGQPGERRRVKIKVIKPNVVVRAKTGYVVRHTRSRMERTVKDNTLARR